MKKKNYGFRRNLNQTNLLVYKLYNLVRKEIKILD
jgi:hypothetical protein